jgi:hypothetical protein
MNKLAQSMLLASSIAAVASTGNSPHRLARVHKFVSEQTRNKKKHKANKKHKKNPQFTVR